MHETYIKALNRHALVATLRDPISGLDVPGIGRLIDVRPLRLTPSEWIITGAETVSDGIIESDHVQTWAIRFEELRSTIFDVTI